MAPATITTLLANAYDNPIIEATGPQSNPGELINWPMLKLVYRTDKDGVAALLPPGIEPGFPACRAGVFPLDYEPVQSSGPDGSRTHHTDLARVSRLQRHAGPSRGPRWESNPVPLLTTEVCCRNTYRPS